MMIDFDILWPKYGIKPYGVLHLGANEGQEAPMYEKHGVKEIIWVEAYWIVFNKLLANIRDLRPDVVLHGDESYGYPSVPPPPYFFARHGNHFLICCCVGDEDFKEVEFNISNNEAQSSSYLELAHHKVIHPEVHYVEKHKVETRRLDSVFHGKDTTFREGPNHYLKSFKENNWFLNADLQGTELQAFKGMGELLHDFKWVYTEVNKKETYEGCALVEEVDEYLGKFGFVRIETGPWVADTWTDALYVKS